MHRFRTVSLLLILLLFSAQALSQDETDGALLVSVAATDGWTLHASYYPPTQENAPAVLLLHQLYTHRASWTALISTLHAEGYAVLAPDLRGYGQTRGEIHWRQAQADTLTWLAWLRTQPNVRTDRISTIGSSMGANLALIGCADDNAATPETGCIATVGISAGLNYFGYTPLTPALEGGLAARAVLLVSSERDGYPARALRTLSADFPQVSALWLTGNAHGIDLLDAPTTAQLVDWLNAHAR